MIYKDKEMMYMSKSMEMWPTSKIIGRLYSRFWNPSQVFSPPVGTAGNSILK
jgi:hypothetical protein